MKRRIYGLLALAGMLGLPLVAAPGAQAAPGEVLILASTVSGGAGSTLAQKFLAAGKTPVVVTPAQWSTMTAADFDDYDAIVLGDPTCSTSTASVAAAEATASEWASVVDGNVVVIGTDETYHESQGGALLMEKAAAFTVADPDKTGAYISLSCYYHGTAPGTPVPVLSGFGSFTATGVGCYNDAHIVATHPALAGITDATLSNWGCSVHEAFDSWPLSFEVLAIAEGIGASYTASDGTVGTPYILARGVEVISDITLSPAAADNPVGTEHTVTATVAEDDTLVEGTTVTFTVIDGPHVGTTGNDDTDSNGEATFTYTGTTVGTDTIEATFVDSLGRTQRSNRVTKTWQAVEVCGNGVDDDGDGLIDEGCNQPPDCSGASATPSSIWPPNHQMVPVDVVGVTDADGDPVTILVSSIRQDEPVQTMGDGSTSPDGSGVGTATAQVRAERSGSKQVPGNGRVYHLGFTATDDDGATCTGTVTVGVPHDRDGSPAVDDGPLYDSTAS